VLLLPNEDMAEVAVVDTQVGAEAEEHGMAVADHGAEADIGMADTGEETGATAIIGIPASPSV
jgi:hypothetical protein